MSCLERLAKQSDELAEGALSRVLESWQPGETAIGADKPPRGA
jgi:hypothetical protein